MGNAAQVEVVFFDARDTLGEVDSPGHLVPYRPTTERLLSAMRDAVGLRIGVITNLPDAVSAEQGRKMVLEAVLSDTSNGSGPVTIGDFIDPDGLIINHEAGVSKPDPRIFTYAAEKMGVPVDHCLFCGENLIEVLAARAAGMQTQLKPCPPGREFLAEPIPGMQSSEHFSGRAFEMMLEHEHLLGDRIFAGMLVIADQLRELDASQPIPEQLYSAMGILVYLTDNFADQVHLKAEESVIQIAVARGMDPDVAVEVLDHHDQGRNYFQALHIAWRRISKGPERDRPWAIDAFARSAEGFAKLFEHHAELENDELFPEIGRHFNDSDDTLALNIIQHTGPSDITPYISLVDAMEAALGVAAPAA